MSVTTQQSKILNPEDIDNPIVFTNDQECLDMLHALLLDSRISQSKSDLINKCISLINTNDDTVPDFNPCDLLDLSILANIYPDKSDEIRACSDYLSTIIDYNFNIPDESDPTTISNLNKKLTNAYIMLQSTLFGLDPSEFLDDTNDTDDTDDTNDTDDIDDSDDNDDTDDNDNNDTEGEKEIV